MPDGRPRTTGGARASDGPSRVHPYIPNAIPSVRESMLAAVGAADVEEFYADIPEHLRLRRDLELPAPLTSEHELVRHVEGLLDRNRSTRELLSFLGAGCYQHAVPAVCDEVASRSEFLTAYAGEPYEDHGRFQALWEYTSMMGELLELDVVNVPTYDGFQAAATALRMAGRYTGRSRVLLAGAINPDKRSKILDYCAPDLRVETIPADPATGAVDVAAVRSAIGPDVAAVYHDTPSYLGVVETSGAAIADIAHSAGALAVVGAEPIMLGVVASPARQGADLVCGDIQSLGMHQHFGGGHAGYIASRDEERLVMEYPSRLFGIAPTAVEGEVGFGDVAYERTSFAVREQGKEWVGTAAALWGITAGVYLALMGPQGMAELGEGILARTRYAIEQVAAIPGVRVPFRGQAHFREFVVDLSGTGRSVETIRRAMLDHGIQAGVDLGAAHPELGSPMLICVTEVHSKADIDRLAATLGEVLA
jgi:glycine dehydrogenase subunit 1